MEGSGGADAATDAAREWRIARLVVSEEKKKALEQKLAAVRAGETLPDLQQPASLSTDVNYFLASHFPDFLS